LKVGHPHIKCFCVNKKRVDYFPVSRIGKKKKRIEKERIDYDRNITIRWRTMVRIMGVNLPLRVKFKSCRDTVIRLYRSIITRLI